MGKASDVFALGLTLHDVVLCRRPVVRSAQALASTAPSGLRDDQLEAPTAEGVLCGAGTHFVCRGDE